MTKDEFTHAMDYERELLVKTQKNIECAELIVDHLPDDLLDELRAIAVYSCSVDLYLKSTANRENARVIATRLAKLLGDGKKHKGQGSLYVLFEQDGVNVYLQNYIPPTCRLVKQTRIIPAQPERVDEYESIVCDASEVEDNE